MAASIPPANVAPSNASLAERTVSRALRPFGHVEPHEALTAAWMTLTVFLLLSAYYLLKTAREPLILLQGGAEVKSYASAGQSVLLLFVIRAYSELARRVGRMALVATVYLFFAANLVVFALLARTELRLGIAFYLWVGIFSVTAIAQFWSFANDIYDPEQGKRLFGILGIGSSVGAVAGAALASELAALGPPTLMLVAAGVLVVCVGLLGWVNRLAQHRTAGAGEAEPEPVASKGGLRELLQSRYVLLLGVLMLLLNCVNSNGEYLLDRTLLDALREEGHEDRAAVRFIAEFKAEYFGWVNLSGVVLQMFVVSRVMQFLGVRRALFVLPLTAAVTYGTLLAVPLLGLIRIGKIAENSLDYSLQNTARQALFLVASREEKYVGKAIVDTFFMRVGDVTSAGLVFLAATLALSGRALAGLNLGLIALWLAVLLAIGREHRRRSQLLGAEGEGA